MTPLSYESNDLTDSPVMDYTLGGRVTVDRVILNWLPPACCELNRLLILN